MVYGGGTLYPNANGKPVYFTPIQSFVEVRTTHAGVAGTQVYSMLIQMDSDNFDLNITGTDAGHAYHILSKASLTNAYWEDEFQVAGTGTDMATAVIPRAGRTQATFMALRDDADSDGDSIPDWWMESNIGHATSWSDDYSLAGQSSTGDGVSNLIKYQRGLKGYATNSIVHILYPTTANPQVVAAPPTAAFLDAMAQCQLLRNQVGAPLPPPLPPQN